MAQPSLCAPFRYKSSHLKQWAWNESGNAWAKLVRLTLRSQTNDLFLSCSGIDLHGIHRQPRTLLHEVIATPPNQRKNSSYCSTVNLLNTWNTCTYLQLGRATEHAIRQSRLLPSEFGLCLLDLLILLLQFLDQCVPGVGRHPGDELQLAGC